MERRKRAPLWQDNNRRRRRKIPRDGSHRQDGMPTESLGRRYTEGSSWLFRALDWRSEWELEGESREDMRSEY